MEEKARIAPIVGMTFFWAYFRYQTVFGMLYPSDDEVWLFGLPVRSYLVLLCLMLVMGGLAYFTLKARGSRFFLTKPMILGLSLIGTIGMVLAFLVHAGFLGEAFFWVSTPLVVAGFLGNYLSWAHYFTKTFCSRQLVLLAVSYFLSIVVFTAVSVALPPVKIMLVVAIPIIVGICWCAADSGSKGLGEQNFVHELKLPKGTMLYIGLFIAFLLAGSVIRGIVDMGQAMASAPYLRWLLSIAVSGLILFVCVWHMRKTNRSADSDAVSDAKMQKCRRIESCRVSEHIGIERLVLVCWIALAVLFFAGTFLSLMRGSYAIGGHIVVVARSCLDFLLWALLCSVAAYRRLPPLPLFLVCSVLTEIISWALSYVAMPFVLGASDGFSLTYLNTLVLLIVFFLMALIMIVFGVVALQKQPVLNVVVSKVETAPAVRVPSEIISEYKLTAREVEVIKLFSQGYSLVKVADELYISKSTAQTHIKSIYRKLSIHSKNDLIEKTKEWRDLPG